MSQILLFFLLENCYDFIFNELSSTHDSFSSFTVLPTAFGDVLSSYSLSYIIDDIFVISATVFSQSDSIFTW